MNPLTYWPFCFSENQTTACSFVDEQPDKKDDILKNEPLLNVDPRSEKCKTEDHALDKNPSTLSLKELLVLVCCRDKLLIYPAKSVVQVSLTFFIFPFV